MTPELIVALIVGLAAPFSTIIINYINNKKTRRDQAERDAKSETQQNDTLKNLLGVRIQQLYFHYKESKQIPAIMFSSACSMYQQYRDLGGNCYISSLMDDMKEWNKI